MHKRAHATALPEISNQPALTGAAGTSASPGTAGARAPERRGLPGKGGRILVIHNPNAGGRRPGRFAGVMAALQARGLTLDIRETRSSAEAEALAMNADPAQHDLLIAAGGDGTANQVLNGLCVANSPLPLAILPLGTANVLARELAMPQEAGPFADMMCSARAQQAWLGEVEGRRFAIMASAGFDARVVASLDPELKRRLRKLAYWAVIGRNLARNPPLEYRVRVDGVPYEAAGVVVAKGRFYGGRYVVAPEARITDPRLHVCLMPGAARRDHLRYLAHLGFHGLWRARDVLILPANEVSIDGVEGDPVQCDGDVRAHLPATIRIAPQRLNLIMGPAGSGRSQ